MSRIALHDLSHRYTAAAAPSLRAVNWAVDAGLHLVTGPSGGGKSTLLRLFNGLVPHLHGGDIEGAALVCGQDVITTPTRTLARSVGFVFQDPEAQLVGGRVAREVAFGPECLGLPRAVVGERVEAALHRCGLATMAERRVESLSGGERQRVAIACALAMGQSVLALDEPTAQLDRAGADAVLDHCVALAAAGTCVVLAEHRLDRVLAYADSTSVVDGGTVMGPAAAQHMARRLAAPPQVVSLGLAIGVDPLPLDVDAARGMLHWSELPERCARTGATAWSLEGVACGAGREPVLDAVHLAGLAGEVIALVGPNGGGKTTLLRALAGLLPPRAGAVQRRPGRVAYLPQDPAALLHRPTVRAEVEWTLRLGGDGRAQADVVLRAAGVAHLADAYPRDLSSGERQRTAIAALLCGEPSIALLDEPTRGMDGEARARLVAMVHALRDRGAAVVIATHDAELAAATADRVVEVRDGMARDLGSPRAALTGTSPYATQLGSMLPRGPLTVAEAVALR